MRLTYYAFALAIGAASPAAAQTVQSPAVERQPDRFTVSASTGVDFSSGDYGQAETTDVLVVPFMLRAKTGRVALTATIPYLRIDGPGGIVIGPDGNPLPGVPTTAGARDGIGDLTLGAAYTVPAETLGGIELGLGVRVKLPTAAGSRQLSTGETDLAVSADISYTAGSVIPFASIGYRMLGDPDGVDLQNGLTLSVGTSIRIGGSTVAILSYDHARASSALTEDAHELFGGISAPISSRLNLTGYGMVGLSDGSPDFGLGLLVTARLF
jgi:hypothetical protein